MRKLVLAAAAALTLTACATSQDAYYQAVLEREKRQAEMELRADTAIAQMAQSGDAQAKGMAIMYFAQRANQARAGAQGIQAPRTMSEQLLPWAAILVPAATQMYGIQQNTRVQLNSSNNALAAQTSSNEMVVGLGQLIAPSAEVLLTESNNALAAQKDTNAMAVQIQQNTNNAMLELQKSNNANALAVQQNNNATMLGWGRLINPPPAD